MFYLLKTVKIRVTVKQQHYALKKKMVFALLKKKNCLHFVNKTIKYKTLSVVYIKCISDLV